MAKFLETVPQKQLEAMLKNAPAASQAPPPWDSLLPYTRRAGSGTTIAQLLAGGGPTGTGEAARQLLLNEPRAAIADIQLVLADLPEKYVQQRGQLLEFLGELDGITDDRASIEAAAVKEALRPFPAASSANDGTFLPGVALQTYYRFEHDPARRTEIFKQVLDAQPDAATRDRLQAFSPSKGTPAQAPESQPGATQAAAPVAPVAAQGTGVDTPPPSDPRDEDAAREPASGDSQAPDPQTEAPQDSPSQ